MNIADVILRNGKDSAPAVLSGDRVLTHGELRRNVAQLCGRLLSRGLKMGDRVGLLAENSSFFVTAYFSVIRAGLVVVPFQTDVTADVFAKITSDAAIQIVLASERLGRRMKPAADAAHITLLTETELNAMPEAASIEMPQIDLEHDLAALMFTSGSTGAPKGVMVTHRNIESNTRDIISYMGLSAEDCAMVVLPFHYCFGASLLHTHLMTGGAVVLNNNFKLYPETVLQDLLQKECTGFAGVPSTYQLLLRKSRFRELSFPKLRWLQQAGGKLPNPQIAEILAALPQTRFYLMYGQTEATARLSYLPPERLSDKLGSIGKGLPSGRLEVLKPDGSPAAPGTNEIGEIVASGDNITLGYWNDADETARFFRNGRLHTGDIARVDSEGFIFIVEREREMIKSGGNRVSAKEVEDVIAELPEIVEVAVIGIPHELLGEAIHAVVAVTSDSQLTPRHVAEHCRKRLPSFKTPEEVTFVKNMPHNGVGKILKPKLREMLLNQSQTSEILTTQNQ